MRARSMSVAGAVVAFGVFGGPPALADELASLAARMQMLEDREEIRALILSTAKPTITEITGRSRVYSRRTASGSAGLVPRKAPQRSMP